MQRGLKEELKGSVPAKAFARSEVNLGNNSIQLTVRYTVKRDVYLEKY